jgi:molybdate transport system regulatory protein
MIPMSKNTFKTSFKTWLEYKGKPVLGAGGAEILRSIQQHESISKAAQELGMSYRYVWGYVKKIEKILNGPVMQTFKGGKSGGGGAKLTKLGSNLLLEYDHVEHGLNQVLSHTRYTEVNKVKISARNRLKGKVIAVQKNSVTAKVKVEITTPAIVTALISAEAVEDLNIKVGDTVEAVVKATEVMIAK